MVVTMIACWRRLPCLPASCDGGVWLYFCSMKTAHDIRDYEEQQGVPGQEALTCDEEEMVEELRRRRAKTCQPR